MIRIPSCNLSTEVKCFSNNNAETKELYKSYTSQFPYINDI